MKAAGKLLLFGVLGFLAVGSGLLTLAEIGMQIPAAPPSDGVLNPTLYEVSSDRER